MMFFTESAFLNEAGKIRMRADEEREQKTTAPRIPAWSPTVVLTGRHSG